MLVTSFLTLLELRSMPETYEQSLLFEELSRHLNEDDVNQVIQHLQINPMSQ
jgi:hypothetical protein